MKRATGRCTVLWSSASGQFTGGEPLLRRSDRTLKQFFPCVRLDDVPMSDQAKKTKTGSIGLWLRPVSWDRMRPIVTQEDLDLSGVDRTLGGSVRSLPLERPVSSNRAGSELSVPFPFLFRLGDDITAALRFDLTPHPVPRRHHRRASTARSRRATMP